MCVCVCVCLSLCIYVYFSCTYLDAYADVNRKLIIFDAGVKSRKMCGLDGGQVSLEDLNYEVFAYHKLGRRNHPAGCLSCTC